MRILALSGWGQPTDALAAIVPKAKHLDYASAEDVPAALEMIAKAGKKYDHVVGWSLGGQMAVRAIAAGLLRPRTLTLIAAPFQFVASPDYDIGMKRDQFERFRDNYASNPERTLDKAWELVVKGDQHEEKVRTMLAAHNKSKVLAKDWLKWLHLLDGFSCNDLHLADFPPTLLVHGTEDVVVGPEQSERFAAGIPHAKLELWAGVGHAPHWHNTEKLKDLIAKHHV